MKWIAVGLAAVAVLSCLSNAQLWPDRQPPPRFTQKPAPIPGAVPEGPLGNPTQTKDTFEIPLTWRYPSDPTPETVTVGTVEIRAPVAAVTVAVACENNKAHVEVKKDFFGTGFIINPADLTLGACTADGEDTQAQVLIFETQLEGCDSQLTMTDDALIYTFSLNYAPHIGNAPVVRTSTVAVTVECHYPRKHNVSSNALIPHWVPFSATKVVDELLYFSLKMMTDDWHYVRPVNTYYLGDLINIQATVQQYFHVPLRVFVDSCVVTVSADANSNPRYAFIDNDGCLIDAAITGSSSCFMPRTADNKLNFQLEAFRFQAVETETFYITCHLTATSAAHPINSENRACSYINGWKEAGGPQNNEACNSCAQGIVPITSSAGRGSGHGSGGGGRLSDPSVGGASPGFSGGGTSPGFSGGGTSPGFSGGGTSPGFSSGGTTTTRYSVTSIGFGGGGAAGGTYPSTGAGGAGGSYPSTGADGSYPSTGPGGDYTGGAGGSFSTSISGSGTRGTYSTGVTHSAGAGFSGTGGAFSGTGGSHSGAGGSSSFPSTGGSGGIGGGYQGGFGGGAFKPSTGGLKPTTFGKGTTTKRNQRDAKDQVEAHIVWEGTVGLGPMTILPRKA